MRRRQQKVREAVRSIIERYGDTALQQVDQRISELQEHGEEEAVVLWQEIRTAVKHSLADKNNGDSQR